MKKALKNLKTCDILSISKVKNNTKPTEKIMLLKRTFPSHFLPKFTMDYTKKLREQLTKDVLRINCAAANIEKNWEAGNFGDDFEEINRACIAIEHKLDKLEEHTADEKTRAIVWNIWRQFGKTWHVTEYLYADKTSYKLVRSIAYLSVHLLYEFKRSDYKLLLDNVSKLKQIRA